MKGLLQSKRFKQNLYKWLFMYVGVLLLLATVITYSRYIANLLGSNEDARPARFHVKVEPVGCNAINKSCNTGAYLFDDEIPYEFQVDTSELEANADLVITVTAHDDFEITEILKDDEPICQNKEGSTVGACGSNINSSFVVNKDTTINYKIKVKYKVHSDGSQDKSIIDYDKNISDANFGDKYILDYSKENEIVKIGYSAIQSELN